MNYFNLFGLCIVFFACFMGCTHKTSNTAIIKTAKHVPLNYLDIDDNNFTFHQDTLYLDQSKFSGFQFALFPNGDTAFIKSYLNGLEEGVQMQWYNNKQIAEKRRYADGKKEGLQEAWWPDGKLKCISTNVQDAFVGELKEWNQAGLLYKDFHYVNGQEEGSERMWWDNGSVRANYVIRHGKRYGLLGIKMCVNNYDSISKE